MPQVESFQLDHRKVVAPYVRKAGVLNGQHGDVVTKFDLRFLQPNKEAMPTAAMHALEHLLAGFLREHLDNVIDISPMGCRTGFYLVMWGEVEPETVKNALEASLKQVLEAEEVPAANDLQCGNYRDLSLFGAKEYAKYVLDKGFSTKFYRD
ncbi:MULTISPECIES: S-ribosylhomocysteine lyase [Clostridium]|uniref:S-ribosylhomocysteine lyase n=2 Tax=Clostridium TaxID=1485 RepID=A0A151AMU0_9CLOT|nr:MULTISPECIES: S-ribosylhomocysteine lyase [Clostridium]KYH28941.1 S-ribosylhomocysteine lyase [Clostridium colicanis DSM 13634]MBE6044861.1 S-ribosylhomocysteine lyase [Clostridium thermopalmarium]PRR73207.1 S-ribosylhomocysteine lyase [Clostridium thermopalmarium DSM 5974]PVZ25228.1 S-ribosylhomocysteine lyase /quorum-sensing autoinducer 2 (AI-2) synthesis protein LuxS [Clostridium thermopalmarium DSM 5974]